MKNATMSFLVLGAVMVVGCAQQGGDVEAVSSKVKTVWPTQEQAKHGCAPTMIDADPAATEYLEEALLDYDVAPAGEATVTIDSRGVKVDAQTYQLIPRYDSENGTALLIGHSCSGACTGDNCTVNGCDRHFDDAGKFSCTACSCMGMACSTCTCTKTVSGGVSVDEPAP